MPEDKKDEENNAEEGKGGDKDEDQDDGDTCCAQYGRCILSFVKNLYYFFRYIFMMIAETIGLCWYPLKQRTGDCCDCCGKRMEQHRDPAYGTF